jgi:hypothetical protein
LFVGMAKVVAVDESTPVVGFHAITSAARSRASFGAPWVLLPAG